MNTLRAGFGMLLSGAIALVIVACNSTSDNGFGGEGSSSGASGGDPGAFGTSSRDAGGPPVDIYANDPPPPWCGPSGAPVPPKPTGSLECPDDKNKPGCGCTTPGEKKACWTGLRRQRNLGTCKDGQTQCIRKNELTYVWGECAGQVLPASGATKGKGACGCFSLGQWKLENTSPCFVTYSASVYGVSTVVGSDGKAACPSGLSNSPPPALPSSPWSKKR
jgi:hypothetical protein